VPASVALAGLGPGVTGLALASSGQGLPFDCRGPPGAAALLDAVPGASRYDAYRSAEGPGSAPRRDAAPDRRLSGLTAAGVPESIYPALGQVVRGSA
jgi:hypothetical protein